MNERNKNWLERYNLAKAYYQEHRNLLIPRPYRINNINLGEWLHNQRVLYKNKNLSKERIELLEQIDIIWIINTKVISSKNIINEKSDGYIWNKFYAIATTYYQEHNDLLVPQNYIINDIRLGMWIRNQRTLYHAGKLSKKDILLLEQIGMIWKINYVHKWSDYYEQALLYYQEHGNLLIKINYEIGTYKLGQWLHNQRSFYYKQKLSQERINLLEHIGMVWSVHNNRENVKSLCLIYGINPEEPIIKNIPYKVLLSKINYLLSNNIKVIEFNKLHPIFSMNNLNLQETYNITLEELVTNYQDIKDNNQLKKKLRNKKEN